MFLDKFLKSVMPINDRLLIVYKFCTSVTSKCVKDYTTYTKLCI